MAKKEEDMLEEMFEEIILLVLVAHLKINLKIRLKFCTWHFKGARNELNVPHC